jgi:hypothetical protein
MKYTVTDGVAFFEGRVSSARIIQGIETSMDRMFSQTQLKSLESLKKAMAKRAIQLGGNCIMCFEYGQKQSSFFKSIFSLDDIFWQGKGIVAIVDPDNLD